MKNIGDQPGGNDGYCRHNGEHGSNREYCKCNDRPFPEFFIAFDQAVSSCTCIAWCEFEERIFQKVDQDQHPNQIKSKSCSRTCGLHQVGDPDGCAGVQQSRPQNFYESP